VDPIKFIKDHRSLAEIKLGPVKTRDTTSKNNF